MSLIDRYVHDVARRLPRRQRGDVARELESSIRDALEARSGPAPTEEDVVAVLQELGPPAAMAASYRPADSYLIGPELYPAFRLVVRVYLGLLLAFLVAAFAFTLFFRAGPAGVGATTSWILGAAFEVTLYSLGSIVLTFYVLQRLDLPWQDARKEWDPRGLPDVREHDLVSRGELVAEISITAVVLILLHRFRDHIGIPVEGEESLLLNGVVQANVLWLSVAGVLGMVQHAVLLWRGRWTLPTRLTNLAVDLFGAFVLLRIGGDVAAEKGTLIAAGFPERFVDFLALNAYAIPAAGLALVLAINGWGLYRALRERGVTASRAGGAVA